MFGSLGFWEILLIVAIIAVLFGGKKIAQLGKGLGEGISNFKKALKNESTEDSTSEPANNEKDN